MDDSRPHLVLVALFFPPSRASGVFRPLATANYLVEHGWRVTVVTTTPEFFDDITGSRDDSLLEAIHPEVAVERVRMPAQHLQRDVRKMTYWRANAPALATLPARVLRRVFPDRYATWIPGVVARIVAVHRRHRVSAVLATGNPWSGFRAAVDVGRLLRVPAVLDYRDSWTLDQFTERPAFDEDSREVHAERALMARASLVVHVNEPMRQWHARRYPAAADRMVVVENGYDPQTLGTMTFTPPPPDRPLRFGYVGTITSHLPHAETWAGWKLARRRDPELADATAHLFGHLGFFPRDAEALRALLPGPQDGVVLEGPVPKAKIRSAYEAVDVLLLLIPSSRYVTAGKTYESMATGKPVVAVHTPQTAASEPMRGYPLWFPVDSLDGESVATALTRAAAAARTTTPDTFDAALAHADGFRRERQLAVLDRRLRGVLRG